MPGKLASFEEHIFERVGEGLPTPKRMAGGIARSQDALLGDGQLVGFVKVLLP